MNIILSLLSMVDAKALFDFEKENKEFFEKSVPARPDSYFVYEEFIHIFEALMEEQRNKTSLFYAIKNESGKIIGRMNLVDIDWETRIGHVGYRVGNQFTGRGVAVNALEKLKSEAALMGVTELQAKTTLDNMPSQKVLERCLFTKDHIDKEKFIHYSFSL
ncbi:GNAT family N-acetyltransferase [Bacillus sp. ISL-35]|uniref:GNAT family N-acetyltransferase n=1 Tax=Bacillus sp. ISL-35 TaxID=2819122 RepID=UPI001BE856DF|nr:GNAT family N-acetyltransferase [Bacillus sp. ISL-35]MBT2680985.1 GNAT family N-acetyltransferase [Bacillus sp. ISL-35]MBT2705304.1 GNAT family N-acetyltransferase [Chryseobacterium sp. ISL-80]